MKNLFEEAKTKQPVATTIFEVNDTNREQETHDRFYNSEYAKLVIGFLESLGYEVSYKYPEHPALGGVIIQDVNFAIATSNCTCMARNPFTRKTAPRKERFAELGSGNKAIRIPVNKEIETAPLKARIDKAIADKKAKENEHEKREQQRETNILAVGNHYIKNHDFRNNIKYLYIHQGVITFQFRTIGSFSIKADGSFQSASFHPEDMKSLDDVLSLARDIEVYIKPFASTVEKLLAVPPLPASLIEWAASQYNCYFYTETMSTDKVVASKPEADGN